MAQRITVVQTIQATVTLRKLAWDEKIQAGDFHALSETPNAIYPITGYGGGESAIGKTVTEWRRQTQTSQREFFRVEHPRYTPAIVKSNV